jgi:hypothetical protein
MSRNFYGHNQWLRWGFLPGTERVKANERAGWKGGSCEGCLRKQWHSGIRSKVENLSILTPCYRGTCAFATTIRGVCASDTIISLTLSALSAACSVPMPRPPASQPNDPHDRVRFGEPEVRTREARHFPQGAVRPPCRKVDSHVADEPVLFVAP